MTRIEIKDPLLYVEVDPNGGNVGNEFYSAWKVTAYVGLYPIFTRRYLCKYDKDRADVTDFDGIADDEEDARDLFDKAFAGKFVRVFEEEN